MQHIMRPSLSASSIPCMLPWNPGVSPLMDEHEAKRLVKKQSQTWDNLWAHMVGPLNMPIQSEVVIQVTESKSDPETSMMASDWIGGKDLTCASGLEVLILPCEVLILHLFVSEKTSGVHVPFRWSWMLTTISTICTGNKVFWFPFLVLLSGS